MKEEERSQRIKWAAIFIGMDQEQDFILFLMRFLNRSGNVNGVCSDNGTNFVGPIGKLKNRFTMRKVMEEVM